MHLDEGEYHFDNRNCIIGYSYIILHECDVKCQCGKTMMLNDEDFVKPGIIDEDHREISTCSLIVLHSESSTLGHRINLDLAWCEREILVEWDRRIYKGNYGLSPSQ